MSGSGGLDERSWRGYCIAERLAALEEVRALDAEVEAWLARMAVRRRLLLKRAKRHERAAGGAARPIDDRDPWWVRSE